MNKYFRDIILAHTGASKLVVKEQIQELWSGYGQILRIVLENAEVDHLVVKIAQTPEYQKHPRGWNNNIGHQRKLQSYQVETIWYANYSFLSSARLPYCYAIERQGNKWLMVLEDLDESGFNIRKESLTRTEIQACIKWLAKFHASFLGKEPKGLWKTGTYWHLETRPLELEALSDQKLKETAPLIDQKLQNCHYKTFVHGDAKVANFCFSPSGHVAAVDFQYVGGGCGMKDLAYFVGSCVDESDCERLEDWFLDTYFNFLQNELPERNEALEHEWRSLYRVAWADFHRFLKGWSPGHWKINTYSEKITSSVIDQLN